MSEAWFGLLGVVVGGVITTLWGWLSVIRQELTDAMVAARLVDEELRDREARSSGPGAIEIDRALWEEHRVALAKVLGERQWRAVADAYRAADRSEDEVGGARAALRPLVQGKRHVLPQRWRNLVSDLGGRRRDTEA